MNPYRILVVEDDPTCRRLVRYVLESAGYAVLEAPDGAAAIEVAHNHTVDLVLLDLVLPDLDGFEIARRMRAFTECVGLPIIAISAFLTPLEEGRAASLGFIHALAKPIEPARLLDSVRACLPEQSGDQPRPGRGRLVVLADDDPVQRRVLGLRLTHEDYRVVAVEDGQQALEKCQTLLPDAVISDALMPVLDGFDLCLALRNDPRTAGVPVVLVSAHYLEEEDRELALQVGASAYVTRVPGADDVVRELHAALQGRVAPQPAPGIDAVAAKHIRRVVRQLQRQAALNSSLSDRCALLSSALSVTAALSEGLVGQRSLGDLLQRAMTRLLDRSAFSCAMLHLPSPSGQLGLRAAMGLPDAFGAGPEDTLGHRALLQRAFEAGETITLPSASAGPDQGQRLMAGLAVPRVLIGPLTAGDRRLGALTLGVRVSTDMEELLAFFRTVRAQIGQAIAIATAVGQSESSERQVRLLLDSTSQGLYGIDLSGNATFVNAAAARMLGCGASALSGTSMHARIHADETDMPEAACPVHRPWVRSSTGTSGETSFRRADGSLFPVQYHSQPVVENGAVTGAVIAFTDLTQSRQQEQAHRQAEQALAQSEQHLRHAQKMEAIGRLAGGVAHDFNNILTAIYGQCEIALESLPPSLPARAEILEVVRAADRAAGLTRQLLSFSRNRPPSPRRIEFRALVGGMIPMLKRLIGEHIEVITNFAPDTGYVDGDPGQFEQVVLNLAVNARDAMPGGGKLTLATHAIELTESNLVDRMPAGAYAQLTVRDTGCGMTQDVVDRMFEPFFTTKTQDRGTGLGLSTVYGIVRRSGGHIDVQSKPGEGTTFRILLPQAKIAEASLPVTAATAPLRGGETILLAEDDAAVRLVLHRSLEKLGYRVLAAKDGAEALALGQSERGPLHLLVIDQVMPHISGGDLVAELRRRHGPIPVLFVSGYGDRGPGGSEWPEHAVVLSKPFDAATLARSVRELLDVTPPV